jgi:hypothetical protein
MNPWLYVLIVLGFFVVFPLFWSMVVWLISRVGWASFATTWATTNPPTGKLYSLVSARVGLGNYSNSLQVFVNEKGIFLEPLWVFKVGHKRLFIPWEDISAISANTILWKLRHGATLELHNRQRLILYGQVASDLLAQNL